MINYFVLFLDMPLACYLTQPNKCRGEPMCSPINIRAGTARRAPTKDNMENNRMLCNGYIIRVRPRGFEPLVP